MTATPFLRIDEMLVSANIQRMARWASDAGVALRPHVKTHKSVRIAEQQLAAGAVGITVATVGEAEVFSRAGCTDIFIAYPLWVDEDLAARLRAVAQGSRLIIGVDSVESAARGVKLLGDAVEWRIEVDSGHHRSGCAPLAANEIFAELLGNGGRVDGVFSFPGHS
ncbi:MAG: alanine racemase, partial [Agromyces sp.]